MREAAIVSTARTPIGKAYKGAFNNLESPSLLAVPIRAAIERAGVDDDEIHDCIIGCAMQVHRTMGNGFQEVIYQLMESLDLMLFPGHCRYFQVLLTILATYTIKV